MVKPERDNNEFTLPAVLEKVDDVPGTDFGASDNSDVWSDDDGYVSDEVEVKKINRPIGVKQAKRQEEEKRL